MMNEPTINALLVKQAVNCGDHAQDITTAVMPAEGETVQEFAERLLIETSRWTTNPGVQEDWYVMLRLAGPREDWTPTHTTERTEP